jgi:GAF domain-containing protein
MSKRDRHLKQRLEELFSAPAEAAAQPETPAAQGIQPSGTASSIEGAISPDALSYLQAVIEQLPLPAYLKDREHTWIAVNEAFARRYGCAPTALVGHSDKEQADEVWQLDENVLDAGQPEESQETTPLPDGMIRTRRTRRTPLPPGRQARYLMGVMEETVTPATGALDSEAAPDTSRQVAEDLVKRNKQLATFNRLGQELAQLVTAQEVVEHVFAAMGEVFDNRNLYIALYDDRKQEISFPIYTMDGERRAVAGRPFGNGMTEYVLRTKKTLLIPRAVQEFAASIGIANIGRAAQCYLGMPLLSGDKALGVIAVQDYEREDVYSPADVELLSTISAQTAAALENVRLYAAEARRAVQLQTAAEISTAAGTVLSVDELLPSVVLLIQQRFSLYYVGLFLIDDARENAILRAGTGEAGQIMLSRHHQLPLDEHSMIGWCIKHRVPRVALDVGEDAVHFSNPDLPDTRSELALPLVSRGQVLGAMTVQSKEAAAFSEQDIAILQTMSDQIATSIANAQLFEQASQARRQAEVRFRESQFLRSVGQAISSSLDLSHVMDVVLETLQGDLGFTHIALLLMDKAAGTVTIQRAAGTARELQGLTRSIEQLQNDIVMDIMRKGQTEVIDGWDDRFDRAIYESQGHAALVRAFAPLRLRGESIGLLEVGYRRAERARITAEEVRLLNGLTDQIAVAVGNARLFDESQQRITEMAVVNEISRALTVTQDVQQLFATIHQQIGRLYDATNFYIATYDGGEEWSLDYQIEHGQLQPAARHRLGGGFTSHILQTRQPILIRSPQENLTFHDQQQLPKIGETAKSWMGVPLIVGGSIIGVMGIQSYEQEGLYSEQDVALFSTIGTQVAATIQNARLFQEARQRAAELAALNELSQTLAAQLNVKQVLHEVWQGVSRLLDTTNFYIALYDREREEVSFPVNASESALDKAIEVMPANQGLTGYILRTRQPLLITEDAAQHVKELGLENVGGNSQSYLGVPVMLGDQLLGVMAIQSYTRTRLYNEHDQRLMTAIAGQAAIALQNARLFERIQQNTRELAALNALGQAVSQQTEVEQVLEVTYQQLQPLVRVDAFFAALYDRDSDTISFPVVYDEGRRYAEPPAPFNPDSRTGKVILTGESDLVLLTTDELAATLEVEGALGNVDRPSASLLYVPLQVGARTIGALSIQSYQVNAYNDDTVQLMGNVANQVAIAIQNARLFGQAQRTALREQALREITARVRSSTDSDAIARTAIRELGLALGRPTFIRLGDVEHLGRPPQLDPEAPASGNGHATSREGGQ